MELEYSFNRGWNLGIGAAWRTIRFRLAENGPVANGIGEERGVPVFLRSTHRFGPTMSLNLYLGYVTAGELRVEDASGNVLRKVDFDPAP